MSGWCFYVVLPTVKTFTLQAEAREHAMKKEFSSKLNELEEQYTSLKEDLEHSARLDRDELREVGVDTVVIRFRAPLQLDPK